MTRSSHDDPTDVLRTARPDAPAGLRDGCLPGAAPCIDAAPSAHATGGRTWRAIELAAAAVLVVLVVRAFVGPHAATPDPLQAVDEALRGLDGADSALVEGAVEGQAPWSLRWLAGAGLRAEQGDQRMVLAAGGPVDPDDARRDVAANLGAATPLETLRTALLGDRAGVLDEILEIDGGRIRRLSAPDGAGARVVIDIDLATGRVVRAEHRVPGEGGASLVRAEIRYAYPTPETVDRALFAPDEPMPSNPADAVRMACMIRLRELAMMVLVYAQEHDDALPDTFADLERYAREPIATYMTCDCDDGTVVSVTAHFDELPDTLGEIPGDTWTVPLFTAVMQGQSLVAFVDGHVEVQ